MAYIKISRTKKGVLRARIQVHGKDPATSENKLFVKHVQDEEGLTESKFKKKINLIAAEMEKQVEKDYVRFYKRFLQPKTAKLSLIK